MSDTLTARELQTLRNMGNEAEAAADEIDALRAEVERLQGEVANRNQRALDGDKAQKAFDTLFQEHERLRAAVQEAVTHSYNPFEPDNQGAHHKRMLAALTPTEVKHDD
jgi:hypothetical protein